MTTHLQEEKITVNDQVTSGSAGSTFSTTCSVDRTKAECHVKEMLHRIRTAHQAGMLKKADYETTRYLSSFDARYLAVVRASNSLKWQQRPNAKDLPDIAGSLNAWDGTNEKVTVSLKEKANKPSQFRPILNFGIRNRSLQYLIRPVLEARATLHPNQYLLKGVHQAIRRIAELLADGYQWAVEIDIKDCYPSFDGERVQNLLPIPNRVTQSSLLGASLHVSVRPAPPC